MNDLIPLLLIGGIGWWLIAREKKEEKKTAEIAKPWSEPTVVPKTSSTVSGIPRGRKPKK